MTLNVLTSKVGDQAKEFYDLETEQDFWRIYLRLLRTRGVDLNRREEDVLSFILSKDIEIDYFSSPNSKELKSVVGISNSEVTRLKQSLKARGLIDRQTNLPTSSLLSFQRFIRNKQKVEFVFPLNIGL